MESDISLWLVRTKISFKRMIYTSNKKYPFYISHSYGLQKLAACCRRHGNNMYTQVQIETVSVTGIKEISIDPHLLPRTSIYLFTFLVTCRGTSCSSLSHH
jgi:hypothetical protein